MSSKSLPPPQSHYTPVATGDPSSSSYAATALGGMLSWGLSQFSAGVGAQTGLPQPSVVSASDSNTHSNTLGEMGTSAAVGTPNPSRRNSMTTLSAAGGGGGRGENGGVTSISSSSTAQAKPSSVSQDREFYFGPSHFKPTENDEGELYAQFRGISDL